MRSLVEIEKAFSAPWESEDLSWNQHEIRTGFAEQARLMWHYLPNGAEKTLALRSLWRAQSEAILAIQLNRSSNPE